MRSPPTHPCWAAAPSVPWRSRRCRCCTAATGTLPCTTAGVHHLPASAYGRCCWQTYGWHATFSLRMATPTTAGFTLPPTPVHMCAPPSFLYFLKMAPKQPLLVIRGVCEHPAHGHGGGLLPRDRGAAHVSNRTMYIQTPAVLCA